MTERLTGQSGSQRAALAVSHIGVRRIDGIDIPYQIDDLGQGINLIHGPNAIGKSRTAAAIQALIWPETSSARTDIVGSIRVGDELLRFVVEAGRVQHPGGGAFTNGSGPVQVPASQRDRYLLTLQQLLRDDNHRFAESIQREAAGGYDLNAVRQAMKLGSKPTPRSRRAADGVRVAAANVQALQAEDRALYGKEQSLADAHRCLAAAREAARSIPLLQSALGYLDVVDELREAHALRASFEDPIGRMTGDEPGQIRKLEERLAEQAERRTVLEYELSDITTKLVATGFGAALPAGHVLPELRERLARIRDRESDLRQVRQQIERDSARVDACRERVVSGITVNQLDALDADGLRELAAISREYRELLAEEHAEVSLSEWLGGVEAPANLEHLRRATDILARRVRMGDGERETAPGRMVKLALIGASVVIIALAAVLAVQVAPAWLLGAIAAIPVMVVAFRPMTAPGEADRDDLHRQYGSLGLPPPSSWQVSDVVTLLDDLHQARASAEVDQQKAIRWEFLDERRARLAAKRHKLETKRNRLIEKFGVAPADDSSDSLRLIADSLDGWRQASDAVAAGRRSEVEAVREIESTRGAINERLRELDAGPVQDIASAHAVVEDLSSRLDRARELLALRESQQRTLDEQVLPSIASIGRDLAETWARYGLEDGDIAGLTGLCERVQPCRQAQRRLETAEALLRARREDLPEATPLLEMSRDELRDALSQAHALADRREDIQREISDIEASLRQARSRTRLEEAIAHQEGAVDSLRQGRDSDYLDAAGWNVAAFIQDRNRTENRPVVFREADSLLRRFTSGAFRLDLDERANAEFRAVETATERVLELDQLSSGTRVQLLIAVRLAFIESAERGPRLPLILDEALGNTDDIRAVAIIDAAIEIARGGRQVIYFTAQQDEIAKWQARIEHHPDVPACKVHDLGAIRRKAAVARPAVPGWTPPPAPEVLIPHGTGYHAAREMLDVAPVDLWAGHIDGVDLWYLFPDVDVLVSMRSRSVRTWGQYRSLAEVGRYSLPVDAALHHAAITRARVIDEVRIGWQYGRPRPVSALELRESRLISERFIESVVDLCEELDGDGTALIDALREGRVQRFRSDKTGELDEYFRQEGFITELKPLPDEMIRARAFVAASEALDSGILDEADIDMLLASLTGVPTPFVAVAD